MAAMPVKRIYLIITVDTEGAVIQDPGVEIITVKQFNDLYRLSSEVFTAASNYVPRLIRQVSLTRVIPRAYHLLKAEIAK
jgi:hypothetical protein